MKCARPEELNLSHFSKDLVQQVLGALPKESIAAVRGTCAALRNARVLRREASPNDLKVCEPSYVRSMYFPWPCIGDQALVSVPLGVEHLSICFGAHVTDAGFAHLARLEALQYLYTGGPERVTDPGVAHLACLVNLTDLDLSCASLMTDTGIVYLSALSQLRNLNLAECTGLINPPLQAFAMSLHVLDLHGCRDLSARGLLQVADCVNLHKLNVSDCRLVTDATLAAFARLVNLDTLCLAACLGVTDSGLVNLQALAALHTLDLSFVNVTNLGMRHLSACKQLANIKLMSCTLVTDAGLLEIRVLPLHSVDLSSCTNVTDEGCLALASVASLTKLVVYQCWSVSAECRRHILRMMANRMAKK